MLKIMHFSFYMASPFWDKYSYSGKINQYAICIFQDIVDFD